mmetsp:Transcript_7099/g.10833  ORF Transcript_7099/g.10833 Transcript_7099/m.10833 type:complete len:403 (+) Transcript_7099:69-1277(+)
MASTPNLPPQWLGLLKWSLRHDDGTRDSKDVRPMIEEDRKFLENVMKTMVVDENEKMRVAISVLKMKELSDPKEGKQTDQKASESTGESEQTNDAKKKNDGGSQKNLAVAVVPTKESSNTGAVNILEGNKDIMDDLEALEEEEDKKSELIVKKEETIKMLDDIVMNGDNAINFVKMGGFTPLLDILQTPHQSLIQVACGLLASILQNNPFTQTAFLKEGGLTKLFKLFKNADGDKMTLGKALGAVSAAVRGSKSAEAAFKKAQGLPWLLKLLAVDSKSQTSKGARRVANKSLLLIQHFIDLDPSAKKLLIIYHAPKILLGRISDENLDTREMALTAVSSLVTGKSVDIERAKQSLISVGGLKLIESRIKVINNLITSGDEDDKEMYSVELEMLEGLHKTLSS